MSRPLTSESVRDEIADYIERGWSNKKICDYMLEDHPETDRREFSKGVTKIRQEIKKFWKSMGGHAAGEMW